jgi:CheY-like chemotaxis protein
MEEDMSNERKTVLLVDDDPDLLEQSRRTIEREFNVDLANSGKEALDKLGKKIYDCIVMDVMMQDLSDGLDTAKKIKSNTATKTVPIIMLTSVNEHYDYRTQIDDTFYPNDKWLDKPVNPDVLLQEIRKLIK